MRNLSQNQTEVNRLSKVLLGFGYDVYISESGTYGFFCKPDGQKLISFQIDYFFFHFSSNHKSQKLGSGHRITKDEQCVLWKMENWATKEFFESLIDCKPYKGNIKKGEKFIKWTNLEEHMSFYNSSSKYVKQTKN